VCQYCNYSFHDGWTSLLEYDEVYQSAVDSDAAYGFHDSWEQLREDTY